MATLIGAAPAKIICTGCATEANNLAILGVARVSADRRPIVTSAIEHPAVTRPCLRPRADGWDVTVLPVDGNARIDPQAALQAVCGDTALVSVMHASNEVGTPQEIAEIARIAHSRGAPVHTDAAQSVGKVPVHVDRLGVDLRTIASHKFYATKGVVANLAS
jgi:cysteine desulfurase